MNYAKPLVTAVALASLTLTACSSATGEVEEPVGAAQQAALTVNALTVNALTVNALTVNALTVNALTVNALTVNGLQSDPLVESALTDPSAREVFKYIVSCALPENAVIDVTNSSGSFSFPGGLDLAPEWGEPFGSCGALCEQLVSACVISRLDFLGEPKEISVRGDDLALQLQTTLTELLTFTEREATYYGDIFSVPQHLYACLSPGQTEDPRVCGPSIQGCGVDVLGSCANLCGPPQLDGSFPNCRGPAAPDAPAFGAQADAVYEGSITVFLQP
jgi:hypothetical protein